MSISLGRTFVSGLVSAGLIAALSSQVQADGRHGRCKEITGPFSSVTVPVPPCTSPVGLCTHGILGGPMDNASYDFTVYSTEPSPDDPNTIIASGKSVITTSRGVMMTNDVSVLHFTGPAPTDPVDFVTTATIESGTQRYKATSGQFVAMGTLSFATGQASGSYAATLCEGRRPGHGHGHDHDCD